MVTTTDLIVGVTLVHCGRIVYSCGLPRCREVAVGEKRRGVENLNVDKYPNWSHWTPREFAL